MNRVQGGYEKAWGEALACLDFQNTAAELNPSAQRDLATKLLDILDRLEKVDPTDLPNADTLRRAGQDGPPLQRYRFFPRPEHHWVWEDLREAGADPPDGKIVLSLGPQGAWRFSASTVQAISTLYESFKYLPPKHVDESGEKSSELLSVVGPTFERTPLWSWGALLLGIFLGLLGGKLVQSGLRRLGDRLAERRWELRGIMLHNAASPSSLALLAGGLIVGLQFLYMEPEVRTLSNKILAFLLILALGWFLFNLVDVLDAAFRRLTEKTQSKLDDQVVPLIRKTLRIFLVIVFSLVVAQNIFGLNITGWLAGLGIAGLAVSLAAQDSVKNLFGSITVFFDKPFVVGQFITFDGESGIVEEIGFRSTRLRLLSGHLVTVPNMKFIDNKVENISARPYIRRQMDVTITYDTPPGKIQEAVEILRAVLTDPQVVEEGRFNMEENPPRISFNELNSDSLNIRAYYWYQMAADPERGFFTFLEHAQVVNLKLFHAYQEAGIDFAFPTQTLYLAGDPQRKLRVEVGRVEEG